MNGAHDTGGMMGFGPVVPERNEPVFHAPWEARIFGLVLATGAHGGWTLDEDRSACENHPPAEYLRLSYYEIWLAGMTRLLAEKGMTGKRAALPPLRPENAEAHARAGHSYERQAAAPQKFKVGDQVRTRNIHPAGHTRLPRYLRGHAGEIVRVHGAHVFPDSNAHGKGEDPQWLYSVRFAAGEVWGNSSCHKIHADLWEPYLESL
ncbi:MAG: nitrile hydratase subunit beta [Hyphomicrobiales bacterium]